MTTSTIETPASGDDSRRSAVDPQLLQLIRATLAAAGAPDEDSDADFEAALVRQLEQRSETDLAVAVGAALLERYSARRSPNNGYPESGSTLEEAMITAPPHYVPRVPGPAAIAHVGSSPYVTAYSSPASTRQNSSGFIAVARPEWARPAERSVPPEPSREFTGPATKRLGSHRSVAVTVFSWTRNIGLIILLFVAWQLWGTGLSEHRAQSALATQFVRQTHLTSNDIAPRHTAAPPQLISATPAVVPPPGSLVALLQIPAISLSQYVVEGTTESDLGEGPGHYVGTALPGYTGNVAIAGHRTTYGAPFNRLGEVMPGDLIYLTTMTGERFTYKVDAAPVAVLPTDIGVLDSFADNRITLTTCTPEFSASQRLVVVGLFQAPKASATIASSVTALHRSTSASSAPTSSKRPTTPVPSKAGVPALADSGQAGWNWGRLPVTLLYVGLLCGLGLIYGRVRRRFGLASWIVLGPAWIGGLVLLFNALAGLAPTTL